MKWLREAIYVRTSAMNDRMRSFTRRTSAFPKKIEPRCAIALHSTFYNFGSHPSDVGLSPAIAAEVADRLGEITELWK
jgi:hypothetical protein